ncbi:MAG TPA: RNA ligase family protein [Flavobacteriales bacterium]|nr:RNA ligase family protein [Flavobacteriales bacterium]
MSFQKYQHVERFGTDETEHIELGECYVFPKIDGTNASVWMHDGKMCFGSRTRELSIDFDNQGFMAWAVASPELKAYLHANPTHRLFGEWLVPHSLNTYKDDAWRRFYVFDVAVPSDSDRGHDYIPYEVYKPLLETHRIDYVPPVCIIRNADYEQLIEQLPQNVFLVKDGAGAGEGVVLKRYDYRNKYGRQTWAKLVTSEFKEKHAKAMGAPVKQGLAMVEEAIADKYVTTALVEKEHAKIAADGGWSSRMIPRLLHTVYYAVVTEELWHAVKEHNNPKIDFKRLMHFVYGRTKARKPELF